MYLNGRLNRDIFVKRMYLNLDIHLHMITNCSFEKTRNSSISFKLEN